MSVDGPVSMKVRIRSQLDLATAVEYETEFVVTDEEEAGEKGDQFRRLQQAFTQGYTLEAL